MRVVIAEWQMTDLAGAEWTVKLLGPSDSEPLQAGELPPPGAIAQFERRMTVELEPPDDPEHEWYGADSLRFPLAALSVAMTPLAVRLLTERGDR